MLDNDVNCLIPHRFPILLVDKVTDYEKNQWIKGIKTLSQNDRICLPHFPLFLCEALAQLTKILESLSQEEAIQSISYLSNMQIDFFNRISLGDEIELTAVCGKKFQQMVCYQVDAQVREKKILSGILFRRN
jgi:3-hydroxyacyl-[acyl-carrier-protein] dehydratase